MTEMIKTLTEPLKDKFEAFMNSEPNQKAIALTVIALIISSVIIITFYMNRINYRVLYSNLSMSDAGRIVKILQEKKINYKLKDGGRTILAPIEKIYQLRLDLAGEGLPKSGKMGFELFDKTDFQSSDFTENIKYMRALQGELAQTITHLESVEEAKVNLSLPRRRIYASEDSIPSASIILKLKSDHTLNDEEVRGIARLVSGSVQGMKIENITIMSTDGRLLSDFIQEGSYGLTTYQLKIQKQLQKQIELKIKGLLDSLLGPGKAVVNAHVQIKSEQKNIKKEIYKPVKNNLGVIRSSQSIVENYNNKKGTADSNETATANTTEQTTANSKLKSPAYTQKRKVTNYEITKIIENQAIIPGEIKKLSIGVIIDSSINLDSKQLKDIRAVIASACGLNPKRGDTLTLKCIKFRTVEAPKETKEDKVTKYLNKYLHLLIPGLSPFLILIILLILLSRRKPSTGKDQAQKTAPSEKDEKIRGDIAVPSYLNKQPTRMDNFLQSNGAVEDSKKIIRNYAQANPELVANVIEKWVASGE